MIYYILGVYAVASIVAYYYAVDIDNNTKFFVELLWFATPCLIFFHVISKIIAFPAYLVLILSKLLRLEPDEAADLLGKMIED